MAKRYVTCPVCNSSRVCVRCGGKSSAQVLKNCCRNGECNYCRGTGQVEEDD